MTRDHTVLIRLSAAEKQGFLAAAEIAGISASSWIRERLRMAATRELEAAARPIPFLDIPERKTNAKARKD
jgi:hypothetical protein